MSNNVADISAHVKLPEDVKKIIGILTDSGHEAYAVGGCVRDCLIGREPGDWDITTSALPYQVKALFRRTVDTGIAHGTVTVMIGKNGYEITTYRLDGEYEDSRHPKNVEFTSNLVEDLKRRDFTINAMAYNDTHGIVDIFGGIDDLKGGIIRCVGSARERFGEDALRILRAVRFSAQLGYTIEEQTKEAIKELAPTLDKISMERIHTELNKMLLSPHPDYFMLADELGIMEIVLPEYHRLSDDYKRFGGAMAAKCAPILPERYAAMLLFADTGIGKNTAKEVAEKETCGISRKMESHTAETVLRRLKMDNATIGMTTSLIRYYGYELTDDEGRLRQIMHEIGPDIVMRVMEFRMVYEETVADTGMCVISGANNNGTGNNGVNNDGTGNNGADNSGADDNNVGNNGIDNRDAVKRQTARCREILDRGDCLTLKGLDITGKELMEAGIAPGPGLGKCLEKLLFAVLYDQSLNRKEELLKMAREIIKIVDLADWLLQKGSNR